MNCLLATAIAISTLLAAGCGSTSGARPASDTAPPTAVNEQMCQVFRAGLTPDPLNECMRELGDEGCKRCLAW